MIPKHRLPPSKEQSDFLHNSWARQNWAHGPVRSGKNYIMNVRFAVALKHEPFGNQDSDVAFCGKSKDTVERIFLRDLFKWVGKGNYAYNKSRGTGTFRFKQKDKTYIERDFYCFNYSDASAQDTISGSTFGLAYVTEGIFCHESFHKQLMARLSINEYGDFSKLFGDTNPSGPYHWLWKNVINCADKLAAGDVRAFLFNFYSNPYLSEVYREQLKRDYGEGSLIYQRLILGLWVLAEGMIYASHFREDRNICKPGDLPREFDRLWTSMDYGSYNPFVLGLWGAANGKRYLIDSYDYEAAVKGSKTNAQYLEAITDFLSEYSDFYSRPIEKLIIDPSAKSFKDELNDTETDDEVHRKWRRMGVDIEDAVNDVYPGIMTTAKGFQNGEIIICDRKGNARAIKEPTTYAWDPKAQERGEDKPIKRDDHALDMIRYSEETLKQDVNPLAGWAA